MHVYLRPRALQSMLRVGRWWLLNRRDAPSVFDDELTAVLALLAHTPEAGHFTVDAHGHGMRRISLKKARVHPYYRVDEVEQVVRVVQLWHHNRGSRRKV